MGPSEIKRHPPRSELGRGAQTAQTPCVVKDFQRARACRENKSSLCIYTDTNNVYTHKGVPGRSGYPDRGPLVEYTHTEPRAARRRPRARGARAERRLRCVRESAVCVVGGARLYDPLGETARGRFCVGTLRGIVEARARERETRTPGKSAVRGALIEDRDATWRYAQKHKPDLC